MTDSSRSARPSSHRSSSALAPRSSDANPVRPRNRRLLSTVDDEDDSRSSEPDSRGRNYSSSSTPTASYGLLSAFSPANSRSASPLRSTRPGAGPQRAVSTANLSNFFNDSFSQSWASVQGFASSLIGDETNMRGGKSQSSTRASSRSGTLGKTSTNNASRKGLGAWGPSPPHKMPSMDDVAAGSQEEREAALKAAKRARILENHDGVNGGLDVTGRHKRRNSDEAAPEQPQLEEYLVYIHEVQSNDNYAGLILRYQCREDAFRKANGLWSRDSVQMRKWLTIPVDACEVRGRPCEPPSWHNGHGVDLLARTPAADEPSSSQAPHDDFFSRPTNGTPIESKSGEEDEKPWTHVRWVKIDSFQQPVEICRVARNAMGYFPPRRKKSIRTISTFSTPRQSFDLSSNPPVSVEGTPARRPSSLSHRPQFSNSLFSSPSKAISEGGESLPAFMRRPGGVGSMGVNARAPGPDKDYLTTWTKKHIPALNMEGVPSMSVMGSETAQFGFRPESAELVEGHLGEGQDTNSTTQQGNGLDKAAAAVETWLRGALTRNPSSSLVGTRGQFAGEGDLIELTDTGSDDGRPVGGASTSMMEALSHGSSGRSDGNGTVRGRTRGSGVKGAAQMPICIECRHPVKTLWTQYSGAGDKASGHNIRLTVYRHLLHNTLMRDGDRLDPSVIRLGILLLLFDVYLTWARLEKQMIPDTVPGESNLGRLAQQPIVLQYLFFLVFCALSTAAFHVCIRFLTSSYFSPLHLVGILPRYSRPNSVSTALLVSSSTKLFPILMVVWEYDVPAAARSLGWAVVANNVEALRILLDCRYYTACLLAIAGAASRWAVGRAVLGAAGLADVDSIGESSVAEDGKALWALLMYAKEWAGRLAEG
ncbi:Arv1-like family-domain-containing protein [Dactylonectria estremocensis]|uniref:Protein ARV n=1 Tax=Dactylonectria estremocensis TaxID=1079267 RepID=A0A9P9IZY0_9HYPO|nr:Arv1-like family-domain-containing protein [Dactylonectria estremocensis]